MADRKPLVFLSDNSVGELPASDSVSWAWLSDVPAFATRWPTWDEVTDKPPIEVAVWGNITGTLANQIDLKNTLDGKLGTSFPSADGRLTLTSPSNANRGITLTNPVSTNVGGIDQYGITTAVWSGTGDHVALRPNGPSSTASQLLVTTSSITWDGNAVWHAGNFNPSDKVTSSPQNITDWNSPIGTVGTFPITSSSGSDNGPGSANYIGLHEERSGAGWVQWALRVGNPATGREMWIRHGNSNGIAEWESVWHSGNFDPTAQPASNITSGTFADARIPNLNASKITAGTFAAARIPDLSSSYVATSGNQSGLSGNKSWTGTHTFGTASGISDIYLASGGAQVGGIFADPSRAVVHASAGGYVSLRPGGRGSTTGEFKVDYSGATWNGNTVWHAGNFNPTAQPAGNITSGTFNSARIPNLNASKITAGTLSTARIPDLSSSYVATSGNQTGISGNKTFTGNITANEITASGANVFLNGGAAQLRSSGPHLVMSVGGGGGTIYLRPNGDTNSTGQFRVLTSGNVIADGTVTATNLTATSDPRLKTNKQRVKARRELIEKLEYWSFEWKRDGTKGRSVMADKVQEIAPEHVHVADDEMGTLSVDKGALALEMVFALIDMLKEES